MNTRQIDDIRRIAKCINEVADLLARNESRYYIAECFHSIGVLMGDIILEEGKNHEAT